MIRPALVVILLAAVAAPARADDDDAKLYACKKLGDKAEVSVSFMPSTKLADLATWYMGFTCSAVVFSDAVACRAPGANLLVPEKVTGKEARALFFDALEVMGLRGKVKGKKVIITEAKGGKAKADQPSCAGASTDPIVRDPLAGAASTTPAVDDKAVDLTGIIKVDDTHYEISKATIDAILANPMAVAKGARILSSVKNGVANGFKLYAIRPTSFWARIGFTNGDTVESINGIALISVDKAFEVYTQIKDSTSWKVALVRRGKPVTIEITAN